MHLRRLNRTLKDVVFKEAFFYAAVGELHSTHTMLYSLLPLPLVTRSIDPVHFTVAVAFIIFVVALIHVTTFPSKLTKSVLFVVFIAAFVRVAVRSIKALLPLAFAVFLPFVELADVDATIFPLVLAHSLGLSMLISTCEYVSICKNVGALAVLETVAPFTLISITILPLMNSVAVCFALFPLADVRVSENTLPDSLTFFEALSPLALVYLTVSPAINTLAVGLVV